MLSKGRAELPDILTVHLSRNWRDGRNLFQDDQTSGAPSNLRRNDRVGTGTHRDWGSGTQDGVDLLILTGAILVLSLAALVLRFASHKDDPSDCPSES
jgi:hypothetical protein